MRIGAHEGAAGRGQPLLHGHVRADAGVHVVDLDPLLPRPEAADVLVVGVGDGLGRDDAVEGEEGLAGVGHGTVAVVGAEVLHHVGASEIAGRAHVQGHPDDAPWRHLFVAMGLNDLFDDGLCGHILIPLGFSFYSRN